LAAWRCPDPDPLAAITGLRLRGGEEGERGGIGGTWRGGERGNEGTAERREGRAYF